ncbi:CapA family protein [Salinispora arenicola]|uniref:CapA family protein n=1 Tax=Salinispora arenicola TaxID=168697 RepID=UPI002079A55F|nr:CapA family protein [Salinispora arenicola]MCN0153421.1 CapA family protein [Salinispora arenicola]
MGERNRGIVVAATGDLLIARDRPHDIFRYVRDLLTEADITVGQLETPYSDQGSRSSCGARGAVPNDVANFAAIPHAGFDVISLASNHAGDWGAEALLDCIERCRRHGITVVGAGADIGEARRPGIIERDGTRVGFLAYCSVAPDGYYAGPGKHGVAPMRARTHYEPFEYDQPGGPPLVRTSPDESDLAALVADVDELRDQVDVLIVSLHWGLHFQPARLADYQPVVAHAAIDAGADAVIGHHPHILKPVEVYRGKVIFYSLGNFALEINERWWQSYSKEWFEKANEFHQERSPHRDLKEEARNSAIVRLHIVDGRIDRVGVVPVVINEAHEPVPHRADTTDGRAVRAYLAQIAAEVGIDTTFDVVDNEVLVRV